MDFDVQLKIGQEALEQENYSAAYSALLPCAEASILEAEASVGLLYMLGLGTTRDLNRAIKYLTNAANKGSGSAAHNLGTLYMTGEPDIPLNPEESWKWFKLAADLGFKPGSDR